MTNEQRERLARYRSGGHFALVYLPRNYQTYITDLEAEREAALSIIRQYADSGSNPSTHKLMNRLLEIYGERPAKEERHG